VTSVTYSHKHTCAPEGRSEN